LVWDFIEPANFIFPHLHFEIGVLNMLLKHFLEEQVEMVSPGEKVAHNNIIIAEVSLEQGWRSGIQHQI
jgi:translation elongation factor EF-Tu-like GTPase